MDCFNLDVIVGGWSVDAKGEVVDGSKGLGNNAGGSPFGVWKNSVRPLEDKEWLETRGDLMKMLSKNVFLLERKLLLLASVVFSMINIYWQKDKIFFWRKNSYCF